MAKAKIINGYPFIKYKQKGFSEKESLARSKQFLGDMLHRRSVRYFSNKPVSKELIHNVLSVANSAPSGANKQPWTFCAIQDVAIKKQIREAAEKEEYKSYNGRMPAEWLKDLAPLQTD